MSATALPLAHRSGGGDKHAPTRREIQAHLRRTFPHLTDSAAKRTALAALDVHRVRPEVDALRWAEAYTERRRKLGGLPVLLRGFDPTPRAALRNLEAPGVPASGMVHWGAV